MLTPPHQSYEHQLCMSPGALLQRHPQQPSKAHAALIAMKPNQAHLTVSAGRPWCSCCWLSNEHGKHALVLQDLKDFVISDPSSYCRMSACIPLLSQVMMPYFVWHLAPAQASATERQVIIVMHR